MDEATFDKLKSKLTAKFLIFPEKRKDIVLSA